MSKTIYIGGRLESKEKGNVVTGANAILDDTKGKKQNVINKETDDELLRLEQSKQDNLNFDNAPTEDSTNPVTSGGVYTAEKALSDAIEAILLLIPSAATALNKLVDTNTMNSSISTATATFRGTYNAVSDLGLTYQATHAQIEAALDALGLTADNNDFAFVQIPVSDQSQDIAKTERFKFNGTNWLYEYDLNTSGFTAAQWAAINSGITVALVTKLTDLPTAAALQLALNAKQDTLTFDNEPTASSQNPVTSGGIYLAIQAVAMALSNYSETTDGRLNVLEGLIPTDASSSNKLTDKAYVDGLIQAITELIPAEADTTNQLADKAYVLAQILAATPAFKGQFVTLAELQAVASPKAGDLGIVRTKDSDGMDVFTVYQYLSNAWNVFFSLSYHPQTKPATTGTTGDHPYNGMGRVELAKNMVNTGTELAPIMVNQLTQDMFYKGAVGSRVPNTNTIFVIRYDFVLAENIIIPSGCVLDFAGGSISGAYTITGANTGVKADLVKIFDTTTTLAGTWNVSESYPEWFGARGDYDFDNNTGTDDSSAINKTIHSFKNAVTTLSGKFYYIGNTSIEWERETSIVGVHPRLTGIVYNGSGYAIKAFGWIGSNQSHNLVAPIIKNIAIQNLNSYNGIGIGLDWAQEHVLIEQCDIRMFDIAINVAKNQTTEQDTQLYRCYNVRYIRLKIMYNNIGLSLNEQANNHVIRDCQFHYNKHYGIYSQNHNNVLFSGCGISHNGEYYSDGAGIFVDYGKNTIIENNYFEGNGLGLNGADKGYHIRLMSPAASYGIRNVSITGNYFQNSGIAGAIKTYYVQGVTVIGNTFRSEETTDTNVVCMDFDDYSREKCVLGNDYSLVSYGKVFPDSLSLYANDFILDNAGSLRKDLLDIKGYKPSLQFTNTENDSVWKVINTGNWIYLRDSSNNQFMAINKNYQYVQALLVDEVVTSDRARPTGSNRVVGMCMFDSTLTPARPIWWSGSAWVDATGASV